MAKGTKEIELPEMTIETKEVYWVDGHSFDSRLAAEQYRTETVIEKKFAKGDANYTDFPEWLTKNAIWMIETLKEMLDRVEKAG